MQSGTHSRLRSRAAHPASAHPVVSGQSGHSLVELLVVLVLLGICLAIGLVLLPRGIETVEARGGAQIWQVAAACAQTGAVWQGTNEVLESSPAGLAVAADPGGSSWDLGSAVPPVAEVANVPRWRTAQGVIVVFAALSGHPNAAGSVYFKAPGDDYRVTVRLESGLTRRSCEEAAQ